MGSSSRSPIDEFNRLQHVARIVADWVIRTLPQFRRFSDDIYQASEGVLWEIIQKGWLKDVVPGHKGEKTYVARRIRRRLMNRYRWWSTEQMVNGGRGGKLEMRKAEFLQDRHEVIDSYPTEVHEAIDAYASPEAREILHSVVNGNDLKTIARLNGKKVRTIRNILAAERDNHNLVGVL